ncbi:LuxR family transcriptional regulator, partial [Streptomyces anthocyanicus]
MSARFHGDRAFRPQPALFGLRPPRSLVAEPVPAAHSCAAEEPEPGVGWAMAGHGAQEHPHGADRLCAAGDRVYSRAVRRG